LLALTLSVGHTVACSPPVAHATPPPQADDYTCAMHPDVHDDHAGECPICGMTLIVDDAAPSTPLPAAATAQTSPGQTALVTRGPVARALQTVGEIEVGEDQISVVNLRFSGWVERVYADRTGDEVRRGAALFDIYSPELLAAQEELLSAAHDDGPESYAATSASRRLEQMGVDPRDIGRIVQADTPRRAVPIRAPQGGFILHKDVVQGARVEEGQDLYRIGNLTKIWVTADLYEFDAAWVEVGQTAAMTLPFQDGPPLIGRVSYVFPTLNTGSRTLTVRLEFDNPGLRLKPGMFARVTIDVQASDDAVLVPTDAVVRRSGRTWAFVRSANGDLTARAVTLGVTGDDHHAQVLSGLEAGEEVVMRGAFLLHADQLLFHAEALEAAARDRDAAPAIDPTLGTETTP